MHAGRVLVSDTPAALLAQRGVETLEEAVDEREVGSETAPAKIAAASPPHEEAPQAAGQRGGFFSLRRLFSYSQREALELGRDPIRLTLALLGSVSLMFVMGYGINMDVEDLAFAVLDRDQTALSRDYTLNLSGSRYFRERSPIRDHAELDQRMRAGEISLALEIPPGFARDLRRGAPVTLGAWIDGAMPARAETVRGYVQGMHAHWLATLARQAGGGATAAPATIETRFRYNPDVKSLTAMVPAVIPLLLMMIPAMPPRGRKVSAKDLLDRISATSYPEG